MSYSLKNTLSGKGTGSDRFRSVLRGLAVDPSRSVYAVGDRDVKVFSDDGQLIHGFRTSRPGISVAVADDGRVFVGEAGHVEIFDRRGKLLDTWSDSERLGLVSAVGFVRGSVLLADARAPCIRRYSLDGEYIASIGDGGRRKGFSAPGAYFDFAVDSGGVIHATNPGKHRVERYSADGELLGRFGRFGMHDPKDFRGCCNPINVAVTREGHVIVTEKAAPRIKVYDAEGRLLTTFGEKVLEPSSRHMDLAVDSDGRLLVADPVRARILVFEKVRQKASLQKVGTAEGE